MGRLEVKISSIGEHALIFQGLTMILNINQPSLKKLRTSSMKACVGLWKATFRILASVKREHDGLGYIDIGRALLGATRLTAYRPDALSLP